MKETKGYGHNVIIRTKSEILIGFTDIGLMLNLNYWVSL